MACSASAHRHRADEDRNNIKPLFFVIVDVVKHIAGDLKIIPRNDGHRACLTIHFAALGNRDPAMNGRDTSVEIRLRRNEFDEEGLLKANILT
jgi:hypothetical protein